MTSPTTPLPAQDRSLHVIVPARGWIPVRLGELWAYRELLYFLTWREVRVRYKQTALGVAWAVIQPLFTMIVFTLFFGHLGHMPSDGIPYPVFTYCALLPWQLFAFALAESTGSIVANQRLVTKVYFPRLIIPIAAVSVGWIDFAISFVVLLGLMAYYHIALGPAALTIPIWALFAGVTALSVGVWLSALNVRYRDVRHTLPFLTQLWLLATPVAYSISLVPPPWRPIYALNPMVGVVDGFRWALLGSDQVDVRAVAVSAGTVLVILVTGVMYFRRTERTFADVL